MKRNETKQVLVILPATSMRLAILSEIGVLFIRIVEIGVETLAGNGGRSCAWEIGWIHPRFSYYSSHVPPMNIMKFENEVVIHVQLRTVDIMLESALEQTRDINGIMYVQAHCMQLLPVSDDQSPTPSMLCLCSVYPEPCLNAEAVNACLTPDVHICM